MAVAQYSVSYSGSTYYTMYIDSYNVNNSYSNTQSQISVSCHVTFGNWYYYGLRLKAYVRLNGGSWSLICEGADYATYAGQSVAWISGSIVVNKATSTQSVEFGVDALSETVSGYGGIAVESRNQFFYTPSDTIPTSGYSVTFHDNGGTGGPGSQSKISGIDLTISTTTPTRNGYTFLGWAMSPSSIQPDIQPGGTYTANMPLDLYALWEKAASVTNLAETKFLDKPRLKRFWTGIRRSFKPVILYENSTLKFPSAVPTYFETIHLSQCCFNFRELVIEAIGIDSNCFVTRVLVDPCPNKSFTIEIVDIDQNTTMNFRVLSCQISSDGWRLKHQDDNYSGCGVRSWTNSGSGGWTLYHLVITRIYGVRK